MCRSVFVCKVYVQFVLFIVVYKTTLIHLPSRVIIEFSTKCQDSFTDLVV